MNAIAHARRTPVRIPVGAAAVDADLTIPADARGLVIFAHGSGSSRHSGRNRQVAEALHLSAMGTLLLDLLTPPEEEVDRLTAQHRFDIPLLARRLVVAVDWAGHDARTAALPVGLFGASTGAAAALVAAAERAGAVRAVVSRGGRPDLAGVALPRVEAPTLLIVGSRDTEVLALNRQAASHLRCEHDIAIVAGATHLFEEPGTLTEVSTLAARWLARHLSSSVAPASA